MTVISSVSHADSDGAGHGGSGVTCTPGSTNCAPGGTAVTSDGDATGGSGAGVAAGAGATTRGSVTSGVARVKKLPLPVRPKTGETWLVNFKHTKKQCETGSGTQVDVESGAAKICKFTAASCPGGWTKYKKFTTTTAKTCTGNDLSAGYCPGLSPAVNPVNCTTGVHGFSDVTRESCTYKHAGKCSGATKAATPFKNNDTSKYEIKKSNCLSAVLELVIPSAHAYLPYECSCTSPEKFGGGWAIETAVAGSGPFKGDCSGVAVKAGTYFTTDKPMACVDPTGANSTWPTISAACKTAMQNASVRGGWASGCGYAGFGGTGGETADAGWYLLNDNTQCCDGGKNPGCSVNLCKSMPIDNNTQCEHLYSETDYTNAATWIDANNNGFDDAFDPANSYCNDPTKFQAPSGLASCQPVATCNAASPPTACCHSSNTCQANITEIGCY